MLIFILLICIFSVISLFWCFSRSDDGSLQKDYTVPDSITTWEITALAMNNRTGFALSKTLKINSDLELFTHIKMPYSAQRYEQITVYAVIYNYYRASTWVSLFASFRLLGIVKIVLFIDLDSSVQYIYLDVTVLSIEIAFLFIFGIFM